jgi:hypothetical protein
VSALPRVDAQRVLRRERRGSSSPVVVATAHGPLFVKLHGASQGVPPLIAEVIVAALADRLGLAVPARTLVMLPADVESDDRNDELRDLLDASAGLNLGFALLEGARDLTPAEFTRVDLVTAARVLWLDMLVQNMDRTPHNPNVMVGGGVTWLIDHGACLPFQHDWARVTELHPRRVYQVAGHVFGWAAPVFPDVHPELAAALPREALHDAAAQVPDVWLGDDPVRRRAAYAAYLWKRLQFMHTLAAPQPESPRVIQS